MLLLYAYVNGCYPANQATEKEGFEYNNFQVVCKTKQEAIEALEKHIKSNKKLNKNATYYIYVHNAYEYSQYWEDTHFIFDYSLGDIKVIEGKIVPDDPYDEEDYWFIEFKESLNSEWIYDYEPMPEDLKAELNKRIEAMDKNPEDAIHLDKPYDFEEKKDEIMDNIASGLSGGEFKPIAIKLTDEVMKKFEEHNKRFAEAGFHALQVYIQEKSKAETNNG